MIFLCSVFSTALPVLAQSQDSSSSVSSSSTTAGAPDKSDPQAPTPAVHKRDSRPFRRDPNPVPPPPEISAMLDPFFKGLMQNDVRKSFATLLANTRLAARNDNVDSLETRTQQAFTLYGKMSDYEVYDTRLIGSRIIVTTYLSALQVQPIRWRFIYYKADKTWTLINLAVDDSMEDLLE